MSLDFLALVAFGLSPAAFVGTSTATGLLVDAARTPLYVWHAGPEMSAAWAPITAASVGVVVGTLLGERPLLGLFPERFRTLVAVLVGALGAWLLAGSP